MTISINEATVAIQDALSIARNAAREHVKLYGTHPRELMRLINSNKSTWSGGVVNTANIFESLVREEAIAVLTNMNWHQWELKK